MVFPAGSSSTMGGIQTVTIPLLPDTLDEVDETFFIDLSSASGATIGTASRTTVTIVDDDTPPTLSISDAAADRRQQRVRDSGVYRLAVSGQRPLRVRQLRHHAEHRDRRDGLYVWERHVDVAPGVVTQTVPVWVAPDATDEPDESVFVDLPAPPAQHG